MRNNSYQKLISHVTKREWVDATEIFRSIVEQKIALQLEAEKKLLTEPEDEVDEDCGKPGCPEDEEPVKEASGTVCKCGAKKSPEKIVCPACAAKFNKTLMKKEDNEKTQKCKSCGKTFAPHNGEYARCKDCFDKQTDAGERASYGRF